MPAKLLDGKAVAARIQDRVASAVREALASGLRPPGLAVVRVGDDPASGLYVRNKERSCTECGMRSLGAHLPASATAEQVAETLRGLNASRDVDGVLLQLPLPEGLDATALLDLIDSGKDVDGFHPDNAGRLLAGRPRFVPCTPRGVMELLDAYEIPIRGARAVVLGRSNIVGKPMALLLLHRDATVTLCHTKTRDLPEVARQADILICATGRPGSVGAPMIKPGAVVIDVGISRVDDARLVEESVRDPKKLEDFRRKGSILMGDVRFDEVSEVASHITPVPGGVGPLTVALLLRNTWESYAARHGLATGPR